MGEGVSQVPKDPGSNDFIDDEALAELRDKVVDILRPLGLTVDETQVQFAVQPEVGMMMFIPALVRPSAKSKMMEDKEAREQFNIMMAKQNEAFVEKQGTDIAALAEDPEKLLEALFGDGVEEATSDCSHERRHPSGFCLDCGFGMESDSGEPGSPV
jgi:hypothetical protein